MVIPLIGFDEFPINPLMREATVTNKKPNTITKMAAIKLANAPVCAPGIGLKRSSAHIMASSTAEPISTKRIGRSRSVRSSAATPSLLFRMSSSPAVRADKIVGMVLIKVINPDAATAPAPIGRM